MPIPTPKPSEDKEQFVARCMSDPTMRNEFSNTSQRLAVCNQQFEDKRNESE